MTHSLRRSDSSSHHQRQHSVKTREVLPSRNVHVATSHTYSGPVHKANEPVKRIVKNRHSTTKSQVTYRVNGVPVHFRLSYVYPSPPQYVLAPSQITHYVQLFRPLGFYSLVYTQAPVVNLRTVFTRLLSVNVLTIVDLLDLTASLYDTSRNEVCLPKSTAQTDNLSNLVKDCLSNHTETKLVSCLKGLNLVNCVLAENKQQSYWDVLATWKEKKAINGLVRLSVSQGRIPFELIESYKKRLANKYTSVVYNESPKAIKCGGVKLNVCLCRSIFVCN